MDEMQQPDINNTNGTLQQASNPEEQAWTDKGNAAAQSGDFESAAEAFEQAVLISPDDARARYNLALAQQYLGDSELAIAGYRRAIDLDPQLLDAYINLGNLYGELGMNEDSLETFQQALELDPESDDLYLSVGDAYRTQGLYQDAIQAYRQAIIFNPDNTAASDNLRDVRERVNEQLRRLMEQERRIDEEPRDTSRYAELASLYLDMRRYDDALSIANQMLALAPTGHTGNAMLARADQQQEQR